MSLRLSKSKYCNAVQCPKMLWLHKNKPEEFDNSVMNDAVLETGNQVGDIAMGLFGDFTEVPFGDLGDMLTETQRLIDAGKDPRRALAEKLCNDIPMNVCTTAYNMGFEKNVIKKLAEVYPDLADHLMNIHDNIKDLMTPFSKKHYYLPAMQGSYSIKYVLPALYPNEPSLDYHNLEGIQKGDQASNAFKNMKSMSPEEVAETRKNLLAYCKLDTYAMVKVWQNLVENS